MYVCIILCTYVCVHACFVGKMKSNKIIPYNIFLRRKFHKFTVICEKFPSKYLLLAFTNMLLCILNVPKITQIQVKGNILPSLQIVAVNTNDTVWELIIFIIV